MPAKGPRWEGGFKEKRGVCGGALKGLIVAL